MKPRRSGIVSTLGTCLFVFWGLGLLGLRAQAIAPRFVPDTQLVEKSLIVVARWERTAKIKPHSLVQGNLLKQWEVQTELVVERVVKGDLKPGHYPLLYHFGVGWQKDGRGLGSYTSTEVLGDVDDVTRPNLWFLSRGRSWDPKDRTLYLSLDTYRGVQPLALEPYFAILRQPGRDEKLGALLEVRDATVVLRTLEYIDGGRWPWPYQGYLEDFIRGEEDRHPPLVQHTAAVEKLLQRGEPQIRRMAAAVYASLAKEESKAQMRSLLTDKDSLVRATALGVLSQYRDADSVEAFPRAVVGIKDTYLGCAVIQRMAEWKDLRLVPALIGFLQTDAGKEFLGDATSLPAVRARKALRQITGVLFPYDIAASQKAWADVQALPDPQERRQRLVKRLGTEQEVDPLRANVVNDRRRTEIKILNRSQHPVDLMRLPEGVAYGAPPMFAGSLGGNITGRKSFVRLLPGKSVRVPVHLDKLFLVASPKTRQVTLPYTRNGNEYGLHAWVGELPATFGPGWTEPKRILRTKSQQGDKSERDHGR